MKKYVWTATITLLLCQSMTVLAATTTQQQAQDTAGAYAPKGSTYMWTDLDDGEYQVKYYNSDKQEKYEIQISQTTGKIAGFESSLTQDRGGAKVVLTEAEAKKKVSDELTGAEVISAQLDYDDGIQYDVKFQTADYYGEYSIHSETGAILERDITIGTRPSPGQHTNSQTLITVEKAKELGKAQVPDATLTDIDLDYEHGGYVYELEYHKDGLEWEVRIDAVDGKVLSTRSEKEDWSRYSETSKGNQSTTAAITAERAKEIALAKVPGATVIKCELDYDDGRLIYEVELRKDGWEHDFEIDGNTGSILEWDQDND